MHPQDNRKETVIELSLGFGFLDIQSPFFGGSLASRKEAKHHFCL